MHDFDMAAWLADLRALTGRDCGTHNKRGVDEMGTFVQQRCREWGWEVERHAQSEYGDCHVAVARGRGQGNILLMGHLDTVYPNGTVEAHPWREVDGKIFAPGACDMKGGLLVAMYAMRALQLAAPDRFSGLTFYFNSEEEFGSPVSRGIAAGLARQADAALVYEPARTSGDIVSARKASADFTLTVRGLAAHAGVAPEKGINATVELAHRIIDLQALSGLAPGVTVTPSVIQGGTATNVVPDLAQVRIDVRAADVSGMRAIEAALREVAAKTTVAGAKCELTGGFSFPPMEKGPGVALMAELARKAASDLGFAINDVATGGASDASLLSQFAPTIDGMGPVGGNAHNAETEYIVIASIAQRVSLSIALIRSLLEPATLDRLRALKPA
ncbi:MAG: M20 family metallopeptidase [Thermoflexales bacterium]